MRKTTIDFIGVDVEVHFVDDIIYFRNNVLYKKYPFLKYCVVDDCKGLTSYDLSEKHTIWVTLGKENSLSDLVHELTHVVDAIFDYFGFKDKELRAYLMGYLIEKFHQKQ